MMWWLIGLSATALLVLVLWDLFLTRWSSAASVVMGALQSQPDEPMSARELREQVRWSGGWGRMSAPAEMVNYLRASALAADVVDTAGNKWERRKLRLFALACWRHHYTGRIKSVGRTQQNWESLELGYMMAESGLKLDEVSSRGPSTGVPTYSYLRGDIWEVVSSAASNSLMECDGGVCPKEQICHYLRDVVNPFVGVRTPETELGISGEVKRLAEAAYRELHPCRSCLARGYEADSTGWLPPRMCPQCEASRVDPMGWLDPYRLAVLSDCLVDCGCTDKELLAHLRSPGPHVRGCWALDAVREW